MSRVLIEDTLGILNTGERLARGSSGKLSTGLLNRVEGERSARRL